MTTQQKRDLLKTLKNARKWLDNLQEELGDLRFMDACPNNWGGRLDIGRAINVLEIEIARHEWREVNA